jgi:thiamine-phosphate pyrophosphorylase
VREGLSDRSRKLILPRLYAIIDVGLLASRVPAEKLTAAVCDYAAELAAGGVALIQYRAKYLSPREMLSHARELRRVLGSEVTLFMNDRADLCLASGFDGVHVGQDDLSPEGAKLVVGNACWVGLSTHGPEQVKIAKQAPVDYIAVGPVFSTGTKQNPDPVIGLAGVRTARALTRKPLVAIGGITRSNAREVLSSGADAVAVIGDLLQEPRRSAEEFLSILV